MDPDGSMMNYIIALLLLVFASAFFILSEAAIISLNDNKLKRMADEGNKRAKMILKLVDEPALFLATIQTGTTMTGLLAASLVADRFARLAIQIFLRSASAETLSYASVFHILFVLIITLMLTYILMVFGKLLPKRIAGYYPDKIAFAVAPVLNFLFKLLKPFVLLFWGTTNLFLKLLGQNTNHKEEEVTEEEIRMMVDVGEEKGVIEQSEKDMINNIFEFDDRTVDEVMTHRMDVISVPAHATLDEIVAVAIEFGYTRIPVFEGDVDNIVGIIYAKDLLKLIGSDETFTMQDFMRQPLFVPETARCIELFKEFKLKKVQLAVVVDEYGGTYGIVTMEDLLESIVGNIQDEYDNEEDEVCVVSEGVFTFDGSISLDEVERQLDIDFDEDSEYDTLGGFITDLLGDIPKENELNEVIVQNVRFTVLEVEDRRIAKIKAELLEDET